MLFSSPVQPLPLPQRIVSLVPSLTELLYELGLEGNVVGITKFCVHPAGWRHTKTIVGGTKDIRAETIKSLQPQLVIASKEENVKEQVELVAADHAVYLTDICSYEDALTVINNIGIITGTADKANAMVRDIQKEFNTIVPLNNMPAAYLIWRDPYMTVGGDTYIHNMLARCGFKNVYGDKTRYPQITVDEIKKSGCKLLLLSSEPYPFAQKHIDELQQHLPGTKIVLVDGEMFSWYGSRLLHAPSYFNQLLRSI